jgi:hypothetical protein
MSRRLDVACWSLAVVALALHAVQHVQQRRTRAQAADVRPRPAAPWQEMQRPGSEAVRDRPDTGEPSDLTLIVPRVV